MNEYHNGALPGQKIAHIGHYLAVYGLAIVFAWIGMMKFTAYEAAAIAPMIKSNPLLSWIGNFGEGNAAMMIGVVELAAAALVAMRPVSAKATAAGAAIMALTLFVTSTLLFTVGISDADSGAFPFINVVPGQFLVKDLGLLGASVWLCGASLMASGHRG